MAQAGDWQRDVLRELGRQDTATGGDEATPQPPPRRAEPTLRLVRSVPTEPAGAPEGAEPTGRPERAEEPGAAQATDSGWAARPAPGHDTPSGQPPVQPASAAQPPVQPTPVTHPPVPPTPIGRPPLQPGAQPPVGPDGSQARPLPHAPVVDPRTGLPQAAAQPPAAPGDAGRQGEPGGHPSPGPAAPAPRGSHPPQTPLHAPESVPTVDPRLAHALGRPQHGESVARRTGRSIRKLAGSAAQDVAEETRIARELQQPVTTGRVIAVTSIRGGVGKSTMAALLGRTFNHYRHDPVLTLEADAALGTLPVRMGADSVRWAAADLARILNPAMQLTDVTGYLVPVSDGGWLLPASQGRVGAPLDIRTYRTVTLALRRYFAVTVVDCETLPGEVARTAMDTAHARVVVAPMTAEGVNGTRQVLDWLGQLPHSALSSTVVALTANSPDVTLDRATAVAHLKESGVHVVTVPYDRHLAQGGPIRTALLGQETRAAAITLAAEAMTRAVRMR
ncbi:hypothetical protein [Streptomyces akebiae]|uniref:MinD-like ATPase involved in chromosome partitioning or flagellar assembly n=1 Tax=Streptomyces akebiae TaxID=2865673 RepID=A0ABX8XX60_9ACTN|nr:hypothetical protein [Streptomyces akebiae]QYX79922.1 hypothetical protein K1J60_28390 [Streptomyces akebiae]